MPPTITQEELRQFCRLTVQVSRLIDDWAQTRADLSRRLMHGAAIEAGEITLDMLALEIDGGVN
jgi:hypothetical protein